MRIVTANQLQDWLSQGEVLEKDSHGPKVVRLDNGDFLKIFRSRRNPLIERLSPAAERFQKHAERLRNLGIAAPQMRDCFWVNRAKAVSACLYQPLPGTPLDVLFNNARNEFDALLPDLAIYIHQLHKRGIYFRSLHLGNILYTPAMGFGLIDFLDIRFKKRPLNRRLTQRNFSHLQRYLQRRQVKNFPWERLMHCYSEASSSSS